MYYFRRIKFLWIINPGSSTPGPWPTTGPWPVQNQAVRAVSTHSSICVRRRYTCLLVVPIEMRMLTRHLCGIIPSPLPFQKARKVGDRCINLHTNSHLAIFIFIFSVFSCSYVRGGKKH